MSKVVEDKLTAKVGKVKHTLYEPFSQAHTAANHNTEHNMCFGWPFSTVLSKQHLQE
jgi:hypothetical protein